MSILNKLAANIVYFELTKDKRMLRAMDVVDYFFIEPLSKAEVKQLIDELTAIYNQMEGGVK